MKTIWTVATLILPIVCLANPMMRTSARRAPLVGKVKTVKSSGYGAQSEASAKTKSFNTDRYSLDSFSSTGHILCTRWMEKGAVSGITQYEYDTKWNKKSECQYDKMLKSQACIVSEYDSSGKLLQEIYYNQPNHIRTNTRYFYERGRLSIKETDSSERIVYNYDDKGQMVQETTYYHHNPTPRIIRYVYDGKQRVVSETYVYGNTDSTTTSYVYDEHNNEVLAEEHRNDKGAGRRFLTEYTYDSQGNWTRCIEDFPSDNDETVKQVFIREIEYY